MLSVLAALLFAAPAAQAAPQWFDGATATSTVINCPSIITGSPYMEEGARSWVGFYGDANNFPDAGEVFYVHVVTGLVGNPCPGGMYSYPEISLPSGVQPAISDSNPVVCLKLDVRTDPPTQTRILNECPQQSSSGSYGGDYAFGAVGQEGGGWPHGTGIVYELGIPVMSSRQLRGTLANPCDCVYGFVKTIDGNSSPVLQSNAGLVADPAANATSGGGGTPGSGGNGVPGPPVAASPPPGSAPSGTPTAATSAVAFRGMVAPSSYSMRRLRRRGLTVSVELGYARSRVDAVLVDQRGLVLARAAKLPAGPGRTAVTLRTTKRGARLLQRVRGFRARLRVTVIAPVGPKATKSKLVRLKR